MNRSTAALTAAGGTLAAGALGLILTHDTAQAAPTPQGVTLTQAQFSALVAAASHPTATGCAAPGARVVPAVKARVKARAIAPATVGTYVPTRTVVYRVTAPQPAPTQTVIVRQTQVVTNNVTTNVTVTAPTSAPTTAPAPVPSPEPTKAPKAKHKDHEGHKAHRPTCGCPKPPHKGGAS